MQTKNEAFPNLPLEQNTNNAKKIGFYSTVLFVVGASIGAGIFLKNGEVLNNTNGSLVYSLIAWIIALFGVLMMALSLTELVSGSGNNNKEGFVGWVKTFNNEYLYKGCKNFMNYCFLPIALFSMPYYAMMTLCDAFKWYPDWWIVALLSFAIMTWFLFWAGNSKIVNIQNLIITSVKFIPLIFAAIIGFIYLGVNGKMGGNVSPFGSHGFNSDGNHPPFAHLNPTIGVFMAIPSILFVVDGFYSATVIQNDMKEPHKLGKALFVGLVIIIAIDIVVAISLMLGGGTIFHFSEWLPEWLYVLIQILIAFGILGIINGFAAHIHKCFEVEIYRKKILFSKKIKNLSESNANFYSTIYTLGICTIFFIIFTIAGRFYIDLTGYAGQYGKNTYMDELYSMCDTTANWTVLFGFMIICIALIGAIRNRKTKKIKTEGSKHFIPCSIAAIIIITTAILFVFIGVTANLSLNIKYAVSRKITGKDAIYAIVGSVLNIVVINFFAFLIFVTPTFSKKNEKK